MNMTKMKNYHRLVVIDESIYRKAGTQEYYDAIKVVSDWMIADGMHT